MKNISLSVLFIIMFFITVTTAQTNYSFEQLQRRLDSLELLQQETIRNKGDINEHSAEIKQLQTVITTKSNELRAEIVRKIEEAENGNIGVETNNDGIDFFAERPLLDNIVIIMGAIAVAVIIFLILAKIFIYIAKNKKLKPKVLPAEKHDNEKKANVLEEIDRYKEKETQKAEFNESVIETLRKLSDNDVRNRTVVEEPVVVSEQPKKFGAIELKNEIVRRFDKNEDTAKIAQDLGISKDQVVMILSLAGRK